ncbi:MAG: hypothetical protein J5808_03335 [Paludibacteraceae bacterium]|nr:hypothetical protein [Paludibacteraceae bacterium]
MYFKSGLTNNNRYTKHYYAGTKRICATIGTGDFHNIFGVDGFTLSAGGKDYAEKMKQIELARRLEVKKRGVPPGLPTQKGKTAEPEYYGSGYPELVLGDYSVPEGWPGPKAEASNNTPGVPLQFDDPVGNNDAHAGAGFVTDHQQENDHFYFHSDHLGSTSYLTDHDGNVSQFVCYTPYGETLVDEHLTDIDSILHNGTYRTRYLFNGKEMDSETGLYYYGARYYEPKHAFWYGVDPLTEKYPFNSAFVYCNGNPIRFADPTGEGPDERIAAAQNQLGIPYKQENNNPPKFLRTADTDEALAYMDCSEFVCRVMAADGLTDGVKYKISSSLLELFQGEDYEQSEIPQPGDFIAWNGHVALVESYDSEKEQVTVLHATSYEKKDKTKVESSVRETYSLSYYKNKKAIFVHPKNENKSIKESFRELVQSIRELKKEFQELRNTIQKLKNDEATQESS